MATPIRSTLLDVVQTVSSCATSDDEVVATVAYLINSGRVLLCGTFSGARIDLSTSSAAPAVLSHLTPRTRRPPADAALSGGFLPPLESLRDTFPEACFVVINLVDLMPRSLLRGFSPLYGIHSPKLASL